MARLAFVTVLCVLALGAPAQAGMKAIWGPAEMPDGSSAFPVYKDLGVDVIEEQLSWRDVAISRPVSPRDPADPAYRWPAALDTMVNGATASGIRVALLVKRTPSWAGGRNGARVPTHARGLRRLPRRGGAPLSAGPPLDDLGRADPCRIVRADAEQPAHRAARVRRAPRRRLRGAQARAPLERRDRRDDVDARQGHAAGLPALDAAAQRPPAAAGLVRAQPVLGPHPEALAGHVLPGAARLLRHRHAGGRGAPRVPEAASQAVAVGVHGPVRARQLRLLVLRLAQGAGGMAARRLPDRGAEARTSPGWDGGRCSTARRRRTGSRTGS